MSKHVPQRNALLMQFRGHLSKKRYASRVINRYVAVADYFLHFLERQHTSIAAAQPTHVAMYLASELRRFHRRHGRAPGSIGEWRCSHTPGIHEFLRMLTGQWPTISGVAIPIEDFIQRLCREYTQWLDEQRGLATTTIDDLEAEARRFLSWYAGRTTTETLLEMQVADIDAYLHDRAPSLRRITRKTVAQRLRCFLRFTHVTGRTDRDFAPCVMAPTLYAFEAIPSALSPDAIRAVLKTTRVSGVLKVA